MGTIKEVMASGSATMEAAKSYADNGLIQAILPNREMERKEMKAEMMAMREKALESLKAQGVKTPEELSNFALETVRGALAALNGVASPTEIGEYKSWVRSTGQAVAEAAKEGGFLGMGGERISEAEAAFLAALDEVLA